MDINNLSMEVLEALRERGLSDNYIEGSGPEELFSDGVHVGWLSDAKNNWFAREGDWCNYGVSATHWMPLPETSHD